MKDLADLGITQFKGVMWNLSPAELITEALKNNEGALTSTGALMCDTGKFTGRAPKDRYIVEDDLTRDTVWWGDINISYDAEKFENIYQRMITNLANKKLYVRDAYAGVDPNYRLNLRVIDTEAWHNFFCYNMFLRPSEEELQDFSPGFTVFADPTFKADPEIDGTRNENFAIINMTRRIILVGGTGYTGETKKGIFGVLNYLLPEQHNILSMHCSANKGEEGDTAIFFGLSGTGKTTLSADPDRYLIGDDEHGWTEKGIFNFEGGCYAKVIDLSKENEPQIWEAIKFGALLENTRFIPGTTEVDFTNRSVTENTRVSYPIHHIPNAVEPSIGGHPNNIFFLTCDAYGVLPPISRLKKGQAMYHFISGYTAKVAGTEAGIDEPQTVFSACFGAPFLPLHPTRYAELLGEKMIEHEVDIWLVNTGWSGGPHGLGKRIKLPYTRAMIAAALEGKLDKAEYQTHPVFGLDMPTSVPGVPDNILNPRDTWSDQSAYDRTAEKLARQFVENFEQYREYANEEIMSGAPKVSSTV